MPEATLSVPISSSDHAQGSASAPITLLEYGDYECRFCADAHEVVKRVQAQLGERLRFVFRNFPLSQAHPHAAHAARAAQAAGMQGHFWAMHELLYDHQAHLTDADLLEYALRLGLDKGRFTADMRGGKADAKVQADFMSGVESGVAGTPTFFIGAQRFDGDWQGDGLLEVLQQQPEFA
jgi:protein-disulfide isomerase